MAAVSCYCRYAAAISPWQFMQLNRSQVTQWCGSALQLCHASRASNISPEHMVHSARNSCWYLLHDPLAQQCGQECIHACCSAATISCMFSSRNESCGRRRVERVCLHMLHLVLRNKTPCECQSGELSIPSVLNTSSRRFNLARCLICVRRCQG